jgi:alkylresorcinol/alkylpyrone synthase
MAARSEVRHRLEKRSLLILQAILRGDSGITTRHFAVPDIERVYDMTPDELNEAYRVAAPALAGNALTAALAQAHVRAEDLDALIICTCTGYLCPGVTSYVAEQLGLRPNAFLQDLVGLGCGAAIPMLRAAQGVLANKPDAVVACIALEVCSAAFYLDDDVGVLVSACLFSDGAAATIWRGVPGPTGFRCHDFDTLHRPEERDKLRFELRGGKLRNLLHKTVPALAASAVKQLFDQAAAANARPIARVIAHPGGRDIIESLEHALPGFSMEAGRKVLRDFANMSSPSVFFVLEEALRHSTPNSGSDWWLVSFGAGFSAHSCRFGLS